MADQEESNPKYQNPDKTHKDHRTYWLGDVFACDGLTWAIETVERDGYTELRDLCLGKEVDVVGILKGSNPIPEDMHPRRRAVLIQILEADQISQEERKDAGATTTRRRRAERRGFTRFTRHRKKDARRTKARKRFSRHQVD